MPIDLKVCMQHTYEPLKYSRTHVHTQTRDGEQNEKNKIDKLCPPIDEFVTTSNVLFRDEDRGVARSKSVCVLLLLFMLN